MEIVLFLGIFSILPSLILTDTSSGWAPISQEGGQITASSSWGRSFAPANLNSEEGKPWHARSGRNQWLQVTFGIPRTVDGFRTTANTAFDRSAFRQYRFEVSNDGQTWTVVKEDEGINQDCCGWQEIRFDRSYTSKYFRLSMVNTWGYRYFTIQQLQLHFPKKQQAAKSSNVCVSDVGIAIDASYSHRRRGWTYEKDLVQKLAHKFSSFGETGVQMSVSVFSEEDVLNITFNQFTDADAFAQAVGGLKFQGYVTRIDLAILDAVKVMFTSLNGARSNARKVFILLSDGMQTYRTLDKINVNPLQYAHALRASGVSIIAVGVPDTTGQLDRTALKDIAGSESRVFEVENWNTDHDEALMDSIARLSCGDVD